MWKVTAVEPDQVCGPAIVHHWSKYINEGICSNFTELM
jgi:hypothetical protein